jgi:hypothetical protein
VRGLDILLLVGKLRVSTPKWKTRRRPGQGVVLVFEGYPLGIVSSFTLVCAARDFAGW